MEMHKCQNCNKRWKEEDLTEIKNIFQRVAPGEPMPSGECPACGALCHKIDKPVMLNNPDFSTVKEQAQAYIDELTKENGRLKDTDHYMFGAIMEACCMFEAIMEAYFGKDIWDWINKRDKY